MFTLEQFQKEYDVESTRIVIDGKAFSLFMPRFLEPFLDIEDPLHQFPMWTKLWDASVVLAEFLSKMPVNPDRRILELGSGLGLVGVVAADAGHDITMTDYISHALNFARANAKANHIEQIRIFELDWNDPRIDGKFDMIVGSEIVYRESDTDLLRELFSRYLNRDGVILFAEEMRQTIGKFILQMEKDYRLKIQKKILRNGNEQSMVLLLQLRLKQTSPKL